MAWRRWPRRAAVRCAAQRVYNVTSATVGGAGGSQPGADAFADEITIFPPPDLKTELRNFGQLGAVDHRGEIQPLLASHHGDPDVAVLSRLDPRHLDGARDRRHLKKLGVKPFATLHQRDRF